MTSAGMGSATWTTIESDPGVFTELIERLGVKGVQVEELYGLDEDSLGALGTIYGLIFLYKWGSDKGLDYPVDPDYASRGIFFAKQVVNDACATQAILSILLNSPSLSLGEKLTQFQDFVKELPPDMAGVSIGSSELLRGAHNSFSASHGILPDAPPPGAEGEAFHFVAYVPIAGGVYEMDGTKEGPVRRAEAPGGEGWAALAAEEIKRRIALVEASGNIQFNLMALVRDKRETLREEIEAARAKVAEAEAGGDAAAVEAAQLERLEDDLRIETSKRAAWAEENERRRTDYIPAIVALVKALGKSGKLEKMVKDAVERQASKPDHDDD